MDVHIHRVINSTDDRNQDEVDRCNDKQVDTIDEVHRLFQEATADHHRRRRALLENGIECRER